MILGRDRKKTGRTETWAWRTQKRRVWDRLTEPECGQEETTEDGGGGEGNGGGSTQDQVEREIFSKHQREKQQPEAATKEGWTAHMDPWVRGRERSLLIRFKKLSWDPGGSTPWLERDKGSESSKSSSHPRGILTRLWNFKDKEFLRKKRQKGQAWPRISLYRLQLEKTTEWHLWDPAPCKNGWSQGPSVQPGCQWSAA